MGKQSRPGEQFLDPANHIIVHHDEYQISKKTKKILINGLKLYSITRYVEVISNS